MIDPSASMMMAIKKLGRGAVFTPREFLKFGSRAAVDQRLSRWVRSGTLRRLARGIYEYPKTTPGQGVYPPDPVRVASAIARRDRCRLHVTGAAAKFDLGLSRGAPQEPEYVTDGRSRRVVYINGAIVMRHVVPRKLAGANSTAGVVLQALRATVGIQELCDAAEQLRRTLSAAEKVELRKIYDAAPSRLLSTLDRIVDR